MQLQLITPEKIFFSAPAEMVTIPGSEGDFGVLAGHAPFVSTIRPGIVTIETADGQKRRIALLDGIAEIVPEKCVILAETALDCTDVSAAQAQSALQEARSALDNAISAADRKLAGRNLALAEAVAASV